jgi:hypothetical protein
VPYPLMTIKGRSLTSMLDGRPGVERVWFYDRLDRGGEAFGPPNEECSRNATVVDFHISHLAGRPLKLKAT